MYYTISFMKCSIEMDHKSKHNVIKVILKVSVNSKK